MFLVSCHSVEKFPEASEVKVGANIPDKKCQEISKVTGRSSSVKPDEVAAITDLKAEASLIGANYVQMIQKSSLGTEVTGMAFKCP